MNQIPSNGHQIVISFGSIIGIKGNAINIGHNWLSNKKRLEFQKKINNTSTIKVKARKALN